MNCDPASSDALARYGIAQDLARDRPHGGRLPLRRRNQLLDDAGKRAVVLMSARRVVILRVLVGAAGRGNQGASGCQDGEADGPQRAEHGLYPKEHGREQPAP